MYENNTNIAEAFVIFLIIMIGIIALISLVLWIITVIGKWKVFEKAGKPGWAAIIPIYDMCVLYEIGDVKPVYVIFTIIGLILTSIGNVLNSIGQARGEMVLVVSSIPVNLISMGFSIAGLVFTIMACVNTAKHFNKSSVYGLGLAFLSFIFFPMLGFSKTVEYQKENK